MHTETTNSGTYGRPTPQEIAFIVRELRENFGWKQFTLADEAGVNQRTVERIEAAQAVSDLTLEKIARALKLPEDAFTEPSYRPSASEIAEEVRRIKNEYTVTALHPLLEARDLEDILGQHGHLIDGSAMEDEMADALASLRDQVQDWSDIFNDLSHVEKLAACRALFAAIREFQDRGYVARLGRYTTEDQFEVGVLLFTKITAPENTPELLRAVVPRRLLRNATI